MVIAGGDGSIRRVLIAHVLNEKEVDLGTLKIRESSCDSPGIYCDYFLTPRPPRPPAPLVDLCQALKSPDRYGNTLIVMVGMLTALNGLPTLTATCGSALASGGLTWINAVLLPWQAAPQESLTLPNIPDLKKKLADLAATVRRTGGSATARVGAVYGFLDIPDGLQVVPCAGDSCTQPDIRMPPASFLRVDGFQELK
jgi:hypothetical protein